MNVLNVVRIVALADGYWNSMQYITITSGLIVIESNTKTITIGNGRVFIECFDGNTHQHSYKDILYDAIEVYCNKNSISRVKELYKSMEGGSNIYGKL